MNLNVINDDLNRLYQEFKFKGELEGKSVLVTGATGLIGSWVIRLLERCKADGVDVKIYGLVRSAKKAENVLGNGSVIWLEQDMADALPEINFDYIIHAACPTQSSFLVNNPVEVINSTIAGARNVLEHAKAHGSKVVYLSSMEIYGQKYEPGVTKEEEYGYINHLNPRSCYPESKKLIECMAASYAKEYGVDVKIARLTQTLGSGIGQDDNRVFAQFARAAIKGEDIVLHTQGKSSKDYVYITDAVNALFYILLKGEKGQAYNISNPDTYISIRELAEFIKENFNKSVEVKVELDSSKGYAPDTLMRLDTSRLEALGWRAQVGLYEMFDRLINYLR